MNATKKEDDTATDRWIAEMLTVRSLLDAYVKNPMPLSESEKRIIHLAQIACDTNSERVGAKAIEGIYKLSGGEEGFFAQNVRIWEGILNDLDKRADNDLD